MELVQVPEEAGEQLIAASDDEFGNNMQDMAKTLLLKKGELHVKRARPQRVALLHFFLIQLYTKGRLHSRGDGGGEGGSCLFIGSAQLLGITAGAE